MQNTLAKITMLSLVSALTLTACDKKTDSTDNAAAASAAESQAVPMSAAPADEKNSAAVTEANATVDAGPTLPVPVVRQRPLLMRCQRVVPKQNQQKMAARIIQTWIRLRKMIPSLTMHLLRPTHQKPAMMQCLPSVTKRLVNNN